MQVKVVRIYLSEDSPWLNEIYNYLHDQKVKGATIFRGVKGFGHTGKLREAKLMDMHFNLPMVLEFVDEPAIVDNVLKFLDGKIESGRVLQWNAELTIG
ncbi:hypothetical protein B1207_13335 [Legionella quinlivanii]|uniref:Uncharacterized protein n=1 Tax=Legionella quinlivanii TaxID=45073 RepID=A0A364LGM3_9GAMM|nr:DUF190 domain-containing protein [Legionella quinlivanii]RAP35348.1 hypothetical protein B1207_13335 [Legionella quinlivanii]